MLSLWRKAIQPGAEAPAPSASLRDLPARVLKDLNIEPGDDFLSPDSIRSRKIPPNQSF